jgi:hypothetical protein
MTEAIVITVARITITGEISVVIQYSPVPDSFVLLPLTALVVVTPVIIASVMVTIPVVLMIIAIPRRRRL